MGRNKNPFKKSKVTMYLPEEEAELIRKMRIERSRRTKRAVNCGDIVGDALIAYNKSMEVNENGK
jgi:hypothetical protein